MRTRHLSEILRRLSRHLALSAMLLLTLSLPAAAAPGGDAERIRTAQQRFDEAVEAYQADDLTRALALFQQAYEHVANPVFLYNAARVAEKLGELELALKLAERADAQRDPPLPGPLAEKNTALLADLGTQMAQKNVATTKQRARQLAESVVVRQKTLQRARRNALSLPPPAGAPGESDSSEWGWAGISGVATGIGGLGLIAGATYLGLQSSGAIRDLQALNDQDAYTRRRRDIQASQSTGQLMLYSGAGLTALGSGLLLWELLRDVERPLSVTISTGPQHLGIGLSGDY